MPLLRLPKQHTNAYEALKMTGIAGNYYLTPVYKKGLLFRKLNGQRLEGRVKAINISENLVPVVLDDIVEITLKKHDFKYLARVKGVEYDIFSDLRLETKLQDETSIPDKFKKYSKRIDVEKPKLSQIKNLRVTISNPEKRLLPINVRDIVALP